MHLYYYLYLLPQIYRNVKQQVCAVAAVVAVACAVARKIRIVGAAQAQQVCDRAIISGE